MADGDPGRLVYAGAQLSLTPTDLFHASGYPWNGTALGLVKNVVIRCGRRSTPIREEPFGPMPLTGIDLGEAWVMTGQFRSWDLDAIQKVFASTVAGASTGLRGVQYPNGNTYRTGGLLSDLGVKLLLTPDDFEQNRFWYAYNAVFLGEEDGTMPFQRGEEWILPFKVICLPDASNRTVAWHLREDLQSLL